MDLLWEGEGGYSDHFENWVAIGKEFLIFSFQILFS